MGKTKGNIHSILLRYWVRDISLSPFNASAKIRIETGMYNSFFDIFPHILHKMNNIPERYKKAERKYIIKNAVSGCWKYVPIFICLNIRNKGEKQFSGKSVCTVIRHAAVIIRKIAKENIRVYAETFFISFLFSSISGIINKTITSNREESIKNPSPKTVLNPFPITGNK